MNDSDDEMANLSNVAAKQSQRTEEREEPEMEAAAISGKQLRTFFHIFL